MKKLSPRIKEKAIKIIKSCKTKSHLIVATEYTKRIEQLIKKYDIKDKTDMYDIYEELTKKNYDINDLKN